MSLQRLKKTDKKSKCVVDGFIHKYQSSLSNYSLFCYTPLLIHNLILCYYYFIDEWNKNLKSEYIKLSNNETCIYYDKRYPEWQTICGKNIFKNGKVKWQLKIIKVEKWINNSNTCNILIGIVNTSNDELLKSLISHNHIHCYLHHIYCYSFVGSESKLRWNNSENGYDFDNEKFYGDKFEKDND